MRGVIRSCLVQNPSNLPSRFASLIPCVVCWAALLYRSGWLPYVFTDCCSPGHFLQRTRQCLSLMLQISWERIVHCFVCVSLHFIIRATVILKSGKSWSFSVGFFRLILQSSQSFPLLKWTTKFDWVCPSGLMISIDRRRKVEPWYSQRLNSLIFEIVRVWM